jgi:glucokinase
VDELTGTGVISANLGWRDYPFVARAEAVLGLPVAFGHDVGAAGDAEFRLGQAKETTNGIFLAIGTGIAGVIYADGKRIRGGGLAGEVGQVPVPDPDVPRGVTILENVASAGAIAKRYSAATGKPVSGAKDVLHAATGGDRAAQTVWSQAVEALAFSLAHCVALLGSTTVVIGGGLSQAGEALFDPLATDLRKRLTVHTAPAVVSASLGENAGLIGSALKAFDLLDATQGDCRGF